MDPRNFESGAIATPPPKPVTPSVGYPTNGNGTTIPPTVPGAFVFYKIMEEMNNVIVGAGLTPNDDDLDQFWQSIQLLISPAFVGNIAISPVNIVPSGYLECDGAAISRTSYSALFTLLGTVFGVGDGSTTFNLPDFRGEFLRGFDNGRGVDIGRLIGSFQLDEFKSHTHFTGSSLQTAGPGSHLSTNHSPPSASAVPTGSTGGVETRPRNIAMMFCIKY